MALAALEGGMSGDRTRTRERTTREDADARVGRDADPETTGREAATDDAGRLSGLGTRTWSVFLPRPFLAALLATVGGLVAGVVLVPLPGAGLLGIFLATFLFGVVPERRRYLESAVAGGLTFGAGALLDYAVLAALGGLGLPLAAVAGGLGAAAGALGHYFGRDLRDGLTREL